MRFYATTRIEFRDAGKITASGKKADKSQLKEKKIPVGKWIQVRSEKDKSTIPYGTGMFTFDNKRGRIDRQSEIIQLGLEDEFIVRNGNTFQYEDVTGEIWKGSETQFKRMLRQNEELREELIAGIQDQTIQLSRVGGGEDS